MAEFLLGSIVTLSILLAGVMLGERLGPRVPPRKK
jgi:hypothetical protein